MNEICRQCFGQYDGKELKNGISVSNLKRSDIQKVCTYDYTKFTYNIKKSDNTNIEISFGESINYKSTDKINIPKIWYEIDSKWKYDYNKDTSEKDCLIWEKEGNIEERDTDRIEVNGESLNFKNSFYELKLKDTNEKFEDKEYLFHNKMYYDMLFTVKGGSTVLGAKYWLGTRTCSLSENHAAFGLQFVYDYAWSCSYGTFVMCTFENDNAIDEAESLRPLVSIDLNECGCSLERQSDGNYLISNLN